MFGIFLINATTTPPTPTPKPASTGLSEAAKARIAGFENITTAKGKPVTNASLLALSQAVSEKNENKIEEAVKNLEKPAEGEKKAPTPEEVKKQIAGAKDLKELFDIVSIDDFQDAENIAEKTLTGKDLESARKDFQELKEAYAELKENFAKVKTKEEFNAAKGDFDSFKQSIDVILGKIGNLNADAKKIAEEGKQLTSDFADKFTELGRKLPAKEAGKELEHDHGDV